MTTLRFVLGEILQMEKVTDMEWLMKYLSWNTLGEPLKKVVLFVYEWYDRTHPEGPYEHNHYKIIETNSIKRYGKFDLFIIAQNE